MYQKEITEKLNTKYNIQRKLTGKESVWRGLSYSSYASKISNMFFQLKMKICSFRCMMIIFFALAGEIGIEISVCSEALDANFWWPLSDVIPRIKPRAFLGLYKFC